MSRYWCFCGLVAYVGLYPQSKFCGDCFLSSMIPVSFKHVTAASMLSNLGSRCKACWEARERELLKAAIEEEEQGWLQCISRQTTHRNRRAATLARQAHGLLDVRSVSLEVVASAAAGNSMHAHPNKTSCKKHVHTD